MKRYSSLLTVILLTALVASAQTEADLKRHFEGRHVTLKIDMPATKDGVNVYPERAQPFDYSEYATRLKRHGASIRRGETVMITKIKVKGRHVEFQLGGGGYGTFGDETDAHVYVPSAGKSRREKHLENELKRETNPVRRKRLKEEIDSLRREREREDRLNQAIAEEAEEARRARIEEKALRGGGRFNVHFTLPDSGNMTPGAITDALRKYVDFSDNDDEDGGDDSSMRNTSYEFGPRVVSVGPRTTYLKEGLSEQEVLRLLGRPSLSIRAADKPADTIHEFPRGEGRHILAEFRDGVLVRARTVDRGQLVRADAAKLRPRIRPTNSCRSDMSPIE